MQNYELLFVLPGTLADGETAVVVEKVKDIVEKNKGLDWSLETMDKKRLAYPIKHIRYGYFYVAFFKAEQNDVARMQADLRVFTELLRAVIQKSSAKNAVRKIDFGAIYGETQVVQPAFQPTFAPTETPTETSVVSDVESPAEQQPVDVIEKQNDNAVAEVVSNKRASKKVDLDEIDKKLDEILEIDLGSV